ncbi:MAG: type I restriction endonuclease [Metallibacterium sp.]
MATASRWKTSSPSPSVTGPHHDPRLSEADVENTALHWLRGLGWRVKYGPDLARGMPEAERSDPGYRDVILEGRLRDALTRLNPELPAEALADAQRKLLRLDAPR